MTVKCWRFFDGAVTILEEVVIVGLAAWRLTALIAYERGPGNIFLHFREQLGFEHGDSGEPTMIPAKWELLGCPWCLSIWMAAAMFGLWHLLPEAVLIIAASSILLAVERWNHS